MQEPPREMQDAPARPAFPLYADPRNPGGRRALPGSFSCTWSTCSCISYPGTARSPP